jgi:hypothetical protein
MYSCIMGQRKNLSEENVKLSSQNVPHLVLINLHVKTCSLHYMSMSGMSAIVLACKLAHMAGVAELPKVGGEASVTKFGPNFGQVSIMFQTLFFFENLTYNFVRILS